MDCKTCKETRQNVEPVPYIAHESAMARQERTIKRLVIALIVAAILAFVTNLAWLYEWTQYDYAGESIETTYQQDGEGTNIIGDDNKVDNGAEKNS